MHHVQICTVVMNVDATGCGLEMEKHAMVKFTIVFRKLILMIEYSLNIFRCE